MVKIRNLEGDQIQDIDKKSLAFTMASQITKRVFAENNK
jgi:hypothetical protein